MARRKVEIAGPERMPLVYVAGPFRGASNWEVQQNVRRAEAMALRVWELGAAALCPHKNNQHLTADVWINGTLEMLRRCDAMIVLPGWSQSRGTCGEIAEAEKLKIPVFYTIPQLYSWVAKWRGPKC